MQQITTNERQRLAYVDVLKGLGIILVVLGHFMEYYRGRSNLFNASFECLYLFHMAVFCMCSGLVAKFNLRKLILQQVWLYLLCQAALFVFRVRILGEVMENPLWMEIMLPWRHMWYLYAMIFWELTVPLLRAAAKYLGAAGAAAVMVLVALLCTAGGAVEWQYSLGRVVAFYPFYAFGALFGSQVNAWAKASARCLWVRLPALAALAVGYGYRFLTVLREQPAVYENAKIFQDRTYALGGYTGADRLLFYGIGLLTAWLLIPVLGEWHTLAVLGKRTLPVYLLHMPLYAWLVQLQLYAVVNDLSVAAVAAWVIAASCGTICLAASGPVLGAATLVADLWYKIVPRLGRALLSCVIKNRK